MRLDQLGELFIERCCEVFYETYRQAANDPEFDIPLAVWPDLPERYRSDLLAGMTGLLAYLAENVQTPDHKEHPHSGAAIRLYPLILGALYAAVGAEPEEADDMNTYLSRYPAPTTPEQVMRLAQDALRAIHSEGWHG